MVDEERDPASGGGGAARGASPAASRAWVAPESDVEAPVVRPETTNRRPAEESDEADLPVALEPMTVSDILDGSFAIIKRRPAAIIGAVAVIIVPLQLLNAFAQHDTNIFEGGVFSFTSTTPLSGSLVLLRVIVALLSMLALFFVGGVIASFVSAWYAGREIGSKQALAASFRRTGPFVACFLLLTPLKAVAYVMCFVPALVPVTFFALTAPVITIEGLGPIAGIKRSAQLVARRFWPVLGVIVLAGVITTVLSACLQVLPALAAALLPEPANWIVLGIGQSAIALLTTSFVTGVAVLLYLDLRIRTEGLDLDVRTVDAFTRAG